MDLGALIGRIGRVLRKDPRYVAARVLHEVRMDAERWLAPRRLRGLDIAALARARGLADVDALWQALARRAYAHPRLEDASALERLAPGALHGIRQAAGRALCNEVELLGSGPVTLPPAIDWHADLKTGHRWPPQFHRRIEYANLGRPSDVKLPWELSRLQWALPLGQAWQLWRDEAHARKARALLEDWIAANPYGASVNWACTMEPALRILTWTWMFHAFHDAESWNDAGFRKTFLEALYLHGDFVARNLEKADINGNHYVADAAGLVYAGLFFGDLGDAATWARTGWDILGGELSKQVFADGVDFEASVPYHRLVTELFAYPALYRQRLGLEVPPAYGARLRQMARFIAAYMRTDGSSPLWGDADDGRALAFGVQALSDHRYLIGIVGHAFDDPDLLQAFGGPRDEIAWILGVAAAAALPQRDAPAHAASQAFPEGGFYVMRHARSHVFIDCGPLGLAGRGGHGHNDLLAFEAALDGVLLFSDCGAYLYTASMEERNCFRSTALHNTPQVDGEEINRFVRPDNLWTLHDDARHTLHAFESDADGSVFDGAHDGYARLPDPVVVRRRIELRHADHALRIHDAFVCAGRHRWRVPLHLAPGMQVRSHAQDTGVVMLSDGVRAFRLSWSAPTAWQCRIEAARVSPSYGCVVPTQALIFEREGDALPLTVAVAPAGDAQ